MGSFSLSDLFGVGADGTHALGVSGFHDFDGRRGILEKESQQNLDHKFSWSVGVIVHKHSEHTGPFELFLGAIQNFNSAVPVATVIANAVAVAAKDFFLIAR